MKVARNYMPVTLKFCALYTDTNVHSVTYRLGQTYLMFCCSSPVGQNFSIFEKFDHVIELIYTCTRFVKNGSFVAQHGSRFRLHCAIGSRIINCSQEEAFSNLLSRLEEDKFSDSDFFFFLPATWAYFVIELARATKHQVGLA